MLHIIHGFAYPEMHVFVLMLGICLYVNYNSALMCQKSCCLLVRILCTLLCDYAPTSSAGFYSHWCYAWGTALTCSEYKPRMLCLLLWHIAPLECIMISLGNRLNVCMLFCEPQGFFLFIQREMNWYTPFLIISRCGRFVITYLWRLQQWDTCSSKIHFITDISLTKKLGKKWEMREDFIWIEI